MAMLEHSHACEAGDARLIGESLRLTLHEIPSLRAAPLNLCTQMIERKACWGKEKKQ